MRWNILHDCAQLGNACYAFSTISSDYLGKLCAESLKKAGINIDNVSIRSLCSYFAVQADYFLNDSTTDIEIQNSLAISDDKNFHIDKVKILLVILSAFIFVLFGISFFFAICFGLASNSNNIGFDNVVSLCDALEKVRIKAQNDFSRM